MILKPRRSRTKMSTRRRMSRTEKFNRYHFFKTMLKYGRHKLAYWWKK